jgi:hypothetical protein
MIIPTTGRVYVDSNVLIYFVEKTAPYYALLQPLWRASNLGSVQLVASQLAILETLVHPL